MRYQDKFRGCLIGGAVGDALGYPVEFTKEEGIFNTYGPGGITEYETVWGKAIITDDTQMTLYTAVGLLVGATEKRLNPAAPDYGYYLNAAYGDWYKSQTSYVPGPTKGERCWLNNVPRINARRAPGNTCLSACSDPKVGTIDDPINKSKGCGSVMRVAPIGLFFEGSSWTMDQIDMLGAEAGALTHGHPLGYIPCAALVHIVHLLAHDPEMTVKQAALDANRALARLFADTEFAQVQIKLIERAIELSESDTPDLEAIHQLGEGWVSEEALAVALYCALKYDDDFEKCIIASVNHRGDSDSTGAIAGNILGARLGLSAIPKKFLKKLELKEVITEVADDLFESANDAVYDTSPWQKKYVHHSYKG